MTVSRELQPTAHSPYRRDDEAGLVVRSMPGLAWSAGRDGTTELLNHRLAEYTGMSIEAHEQGGRGAGLWWTQVLHPDDVESWARAWSHARDTGEPWETEHRIRRCDGTYRWFRTSVQPVCDRDGGVQRWYGVDLDMDDRRRTQETLDAIPAIVWRATSAGEPDYQNQRAERYSGGTLADFQNLGWQKNYVHPDDVAGVARAWAHALATETPFDVVSRNRAADGSYRWFKLRGEPVRDETGRIIHWYGVDVDIHDCKKTEETLRATQAKLSRASEIAMVSELAASIAHEISQPLAALVANAHACQRWMSAEPPNLERAQLVVERIIRDGHVAADVVSRIRALFKRQDSTRTLLDLNEVIIEVSRLMADEASSRNVGIATDLEVGLPQTLADRVQLQQLIANLARNGVDAMESMNGSPRVLSIRSRRHETNGLLIEISDQGSGLEDVETVFEPFVTTKEKGMGMGLAICRWIVEAHQGRLWATRNTPRGATFSFTLPTASRDAHELEG